MVRFRGPIRLGETQPVTAPAHIAEEAMAHQAAIGAGAYHDLTRPVPALGLDSDMAAIRNRQAHTAPPNLECRRALVRESNQGCLLHAGNLNAS